MNSQSISAVSFFPSFRDLMYFVYICICTTHRPGACRGQKRESNPLSNQMVVSHHMGNGKWKQVPCNISPAHKWSFFMAIINSTLCTVSQVVYQEQNWHEKNYRNKMSGQQWWRSLQCTSWHLFVEFCDLKDTFILPSRPSVILSEITLFWEKKNSQVYTSVM